MSRQDRTNRVDESSPSTLAQDLTPEDAVDRDAADRPSREKPLRCRFCEYRIPPSRDADDGFCTDHCRRATDERDGFVGGHGFKRFRTGVEVLDAQLPEGIPSNACVLLSAEDGVRRKELETELVWRALERGEPAIVVTYGDPPVSIVERFLARDWNVLPHLEDDRLRIVDCLTHQLEDREQFFERLDDWNEHLHELVASATKTIRDPSDIREVSNQLDNGMEDLEMVDRGVVVVDSLNELGRLVQDLRAISFVVDVRTDVAKSRFVPVFTGISVEHDAESFPHRHDYVFDGIVDLRLNAELIDGARIKELSVRKMNEVLYDPWWTAYEMVHGRGLVAVDPFRDLDALYGTAGRSIESSTPRR